MAYNFQTLSAKKDAHFEVVYHSAELIPWKIEYFE
jgi:hypothetical protein